MSVLFVLSVIAVQISHGKLLCQQSFFNTLYDMDCLFDILSNFKREIIFQGNKGVVLQIYSQRRLIRFDMGINIVYKVIILVCIL